MDVVVVLVDILSFVLEYFSLLHLLKRLAPALAILLC